MNGLVSWCNSNQGFLTAIFSAASLLISTVAIFISIQTARMPFKKKIRISGGTYITIDEVGLNVTVTNVGQCPVKVNMIGFLIDGKQLFNKFTISSSQIMLHTSESTTHYLSIAELQTSIIQAKVGITCSVYAFMRDSEEKVYKKYVCDVNKILSYH